MTKSDLRLKKWPKGHPEIVLEFTFSALSNATNPISLYLDQKKRGETSLFQRLNCCCGWCMNSDNNSPEFNRNLLHFQFISIVNVRTKKSTDLKIRETIGKREVSPPGPVYNTIAIVGNEIRRYYFICSSNVRERKKGEGKLKHGGT